jgi:predicted NACHT family NTPase
MLQVYQQFLEGSVHREDEEVELPNESLQQHSRAMAHLQNRQQKELEYIRQIEERKIEIELKNAEKEERLQKRREAIRITTQQEQLKRMVAEKIREDVRREVMAKEERER